MKSESRDRRRRHSLSLRLLVLTVGFVMIIEVAIFVPSIARFRQVYLEDHIADAHLATLVLHGVPSREIDPQLESALLAHAGLLGIELWEPPRAYLMLGRNPGADAKVDLRDETPWIRIREAFVTLAHGGKRVLSVVGPAPLQPSLMVEVYLDERALYRAMVHYSQRILALSAIISLFTAGLVYLSLQWIMVRALRRVTANLIAFRDAPEDRSRRIRPSRRRDEIGVLERELAEMQREVRESLARRTRLAALGTAVSKINHDLKSILSTVSLSSERLARADDPAVARVAQLLVNSVEKAVYLCTQTLDLARGEQAAPNRAIFLLANLLEEVGEAVRIASGHAVNWLIDVDEELTVDADRERLYRVFLNLGLNAAQASPGDATIRIAARREAKSVVVSVADQGTGILEDARAHLFQPFAPSGRPGGSGLGLATARDLVRAHGGDLTLEYTGSHGTCFRVSLPG